MARKLGPYSRTSLPTYSGKTREGAFLHGTRALLVKHVGGNPTEAQKILIEAAAQLKLRITLMDRKFAQTRVQTDHDTHTYLAWVGSLSRLMTRLDELRPSEPPTGAIDLQSYIRERNRG